VEYALTTNAPAQLDSSGNTANTKEYPTNSTIQCQSMVNKLNQHYHPANFAEHDSSGRESLFTGLGIFLEADIYVDHGIIKT
jgi:hypothetical protein